MPFTANARLEPSGETVRFPSEVTHLSSANVTTVPAVVIVKVIGEVIWRLPAVVLVGATQMMAPGVGSAAATRASRQRASFFTVEELVKVADGFVGLLGLRGV